MKRAWFTLRSGTASDWIAAAVFALAFVGAVEGPWIVGGLS